MTAMTKKANLSIHRINKIEESRFPELFPLYDYVRHNEQLAQK